MISQPLKEVVVLSQSKQGFVVPYAVSRLVKIHKTVLNPDANLVILDPLVELEYRKSNTTTVVANADPVAREVNFSRECILIPFSSFRFFVQVIERSHEDLSTVGLSVRSAVLEALYQGNRFFHIYSKSYHTTLGNGGVSDHRRVHAFDICCFLTPFLRKLQYIEHLNLKSEEFDAATDTQWIESYKRKVGQYVYDDIRAVIAAADEAADADDIAATPRGPARTAHAQQFAQQLRHASMELDGFSPGDDASEEEQTRGELQSADVRADLELQAYEQLTLTQEAKVMMMSPSGLQRWWVTTGRENFPNLYVVARSKLATPAGSGVLENDFSMSSNLLTRRRSLIDPSYAEMILFCRFNYEQIPQSNKSLLLREMTQRSTFQCVSGTLR